MKFCKDIIDFCDTYFKQNFNAEDVVHNDFLVVKKEKIEQLYFDLYLSVKCGVPANHQEFPESEQFGDLNRVESGALEQLIAGNKHFQTALVGTGDVLTDTSGENIIFFSGVHRHRVEFGFGIIDHGHTGSGFQNGAGFGGSDLLFEFHIEGL